MIIFEKIKWKNFLSTGNLYTEVDFKKANTTIIVGKNGTGKSTLLDALTFTLFGKSFRGINKPQLVNSINDGDCIAEIEFCVRNIRWKVIRGLKPNIFEIYRNDEILDRHSSVVDQQHWFEENVLKMNYKSFTQIVILGSSNFIPFMQMTPAHRREVIEDLLDIKIFTSMNSVLKEKMKAEKDEIALSRGLLKSYDDKIALQSNFIKELERRDGDYLDNLNSKISELNIQVSELQGESDIKLVEVKELTDERELLSTSTSKLKKLNTLKGKIREKKINLKNTLKFFDNNTDCPTCKQSIETDFRINSIDVATKKLNDIEDGYNELETAIKTEEKRESNFFRLSSTINQLSNEISQNNIRISELQKQINQFETEIQRTTERSSDRNIEYGKLNTLKQEKDEIQNVILDKQELITYYNYTSDLLKDGGIKSELIKSYLPLINQQISKFLNLMNFPVNFFLNEEFEGSVISPIFENYSYTSFSEGERQRIDLALLFTWREVAKAKNSISTNLLILDEIFDSSLDVNGTDDFINIIRFIIEKSNIFVISHKDNLIDKFESIITVEKRGNYSLMSYS
jgi:DNA repair exonuclease SbcCD ATPase subunit